VDDAEQQIQNVARVAYLGRPVVGVVDDAALFVGGDGVALHHPLNRTFAVDHIRIGRGRNVADGDGAVVDDGVFAILGGEAHLLYRKKARLRAADLHLRVGGHLLVADVQVGQVPAGVAKRPKIRGRLDQRQARQHLLEVVGVGGAVIGAMQKAVDVVEDVLFADVSAVLQAGLRQDPVADAVTAHVATCPRRRRKHVGLSRGRRLVVVEGEALGFF